MDTAPGTSSDQRAAVAPPPPSRVRSRPRLKLAPSLSLHGKLTLCFLALLFLGLGASCWMFVSQSNKVLTDALGEQARQLASAISVSGADELRDARLDDLTRMSKDLIKSRNVLFVGFLDADSKPLVLASRDLDFVAADLKRTTARTQTLMQVRSARSKLFGEYCEVVAPVFSPSNGDPTADPTTAETVPPPPTEIAPSIMPPARLIGYVAIGVSQAREEAQIRRITLLVIGIGCVIVILSGPVAYWLVYRVFQPIRQLVDATQKIASGDLDANVAIDRTDVIGVLARSFNDM